MLRFSFSFEIDGFMESLEMSVKFIGRLVLDKINALKYTPQQKTMIFNNTNQQTIYFLLPDNSLYYL